MKLEKIRKKGYKCNDCRHYNKGVCKSDYTPKTYSTLTCENFKKRISI